MRKTRNIQWRARLDISARGGSLITADGILPTKAQLLDYIALSESLIESYRDVRMADAKEVLRHEIKLAKTLLLIGAHR